MLYIYRKIQKREFSMEFNEKLQELRKQKGLTQEELAQALYVSRTAISKWESGRGYPNIESLKAISKFFSVTIDELLSTDEVLTIAEEDNKQKENSFFDLIFGLLDLSTAIFLFLPFFAQKSNGFISEVSLLSITEIQPFFKITYLIIVTGIILCGILTLALQNYQGSLWVRNKRKLSLILNSIGTLLFILSPQPYAAAFLFIFLMIKVLISTNRRDKKL